MSQRQLGGRIAEIDLGVGRKSNKSDRSAVHERHSVRKRGRVIELQLLDCRIEQLLFTLCDLCEAEVGRRRPLFLFLNDLLEIELANDSFLWVFGIREERLEVFVLFLPGQHAKDRVGDDLQERPPELFDLFIHLYRPFLDLELLEGCRREADVLEQLVQVIFRCVHEGGLREVQFLDGGDLFLGNDLANSSDQDHEFSEDELRRTSVHCFHEIPEGRMRIEQLRKSPLLDVLFQ